jgi:hypothetical protein
VTEAAAGRGPGRAAPPPPALIRLDIVATDSEAWVAFYRRLGLEISDRSAADLGIRHAEVTLPGGFGLELDNRELAGTCNAAWRSPPAPATRCPAPRGRPG